MAGLAVAVGAAVRWAHVSSPMTAQNLVAALLVVIMTQFPLVLPQRTGDAVIGFEASALVFLALVTSAGEALTLWCAGQAIAQTVLDKSLRARLFNVGVTFVGGAVLVGIVVAGHGVGRDVPGELAVILAACTAYFLSDLALTAVSLALEAGEGIVAAMRWREVPLPLLCFVGIDSLGYLGALLARHQQRWTLILLLVPIATILVAVRSINSSRLSQSRLTRLFAAAAAAPDWGDTEQTERVLVIEASRVLRHTEAALLDRPAVGGEISVPVDVSGQPLRHLVVWHNANATRFDDDDKHALETLVTIAAASINRRQLADEMAQLARHDPLTGLANRRVFTERLDHALELRRGRRQVAILYCDLDGFKAVNDLRGHEVGDLTLSAVADRIQSCLRPGDTAARLGGDEFAVLLEQVAPTTAEVVAGRLLAAISAPLVIAGRALSISASIGVACVTEEHRAVDLMRHADTAMYRAKALGKNRAELFLASMQTDNLRRLRLEDELRQAVRDQQFTVVFQPVVDLLSGDLDGYEALARWSHPELGEISPDVFVPLAEQLGLIHDLGLYMLDQAYSGGAVLQGRTGSRLTLAVNVSPLQANDPELLHLVRARVAAHPDVVLVLELTELALISNDQQTVRALDELVAAGAQLAVDDFGTGYSSISYLNRLPVTIMKIDRSFTCDLVNPRTLALVSGVIAMAREMGLRVVAEGIEDEAAEATLRRLGCHSGQGFYFAPPLALPDALDDLACRTVRSARRLAPVDNVRPLRQPF